MRKQAKNRPRISFIDIGLKKGDVLLYKDDPKIEVKVENERLINYKGRLTTLSTLTRELKQRDYNCQPSPFWIVKKEAKTLKKIHEEWYKSNSMI